MSEPRFFIIGATGFIGHPLARLLSSRGNEVMGLARTDAKARPLAQDGIQPMLGSLDKPEEWIDAAAEADFLIDASQNNQDREGHAKMVERAANLWAETRQRKKSGKSYFLYTSGTGVYGDLYHKLNRPLTEADTPTPPSFVAFRPALEQRIVTSSLWTGYVIRPGLVYGRQGSLTARLIEALPGSSFAAVSFPVSPDQVNGTIHVEDLAWSYIAVIERRDDPAVRGQIFNIINPVGEVRKDILEAVVRQTGFKGTITYREPQTPIEEFGSYTSVFDTTKPRTLLGWFPRHLGFAAGMGRWYKAYQAFL